jgi:hypothetical protein
VAHMVSRVLPKSNFLFFCVSIGICLLTARAEETAPQSRSLVRGAPDLRRSMRTGRDLAARSEQSTKDGPDRVRGVRAVVVRRAERSGVGASARQGLDGAVGRRVLVEPAAHQRLQLLAVHTAGRILSRPRPGMHAIMSSVRCAAQTTSLTSAMPPGARTRSRCGRPLTHLQVRTRRPPPWAP